MPRRHHRTNSPPPEWRTRAVQDGQHHKRGPSGRKCSWFLDQRTEKRSWTNKIFDPMAACYQRIPLEAAHQKNEREKIRSYGDRIRNVDHGSFTPLVFTTSGGMGPKAKCFYSRLADVMAEKKHHPKEPRCSLDEVPSLFLPCSGLPSYVSGVLDTPPPQPSI
ncbi:hypothetical protein GWK47_042683 [Chionoecetes opilio]|uniref:Uncharacterized protein n=1 Tax=Chionoecetes opilio TaxID=41210 RepID=A0A8J5D009_CHIOP|nr:hypothetical protein GWK47_042683 [Chionoecetes opilio]